MNRGTLLPRLVAASALFMAFAAPQPVAKATGAGDKRDKANTPQEVSQRIDVPLAPGDIDLPAYTRTVLPNGLVLLLMERPKDALMHMRLTLRSGSAAD